MSGEEINTRIEHHQVNQRYSVTYERHVSKGTDGFKVTANGDDLKATMAEGRLMYTDARIATEPLLTISTTSTGGV